MSLRKIASGLGGFLLTAAFGAVAAILGFLLIFGATWLSAKLLPWFQRLAVLGLLLTLLVLLPLAVPKTTRGFSSIAIFVASYVFGATLWMEGLLLTLSIWGVGAAILGLLILGVGVVPIAMIATLVRGMWGYLVELSVLVVATFGSRALALRLAESAERHRAPKHLGEATDESFIDSEEIGGDPGGA